MMDQKAASLQGGFKLDKQGDFFKNVLKRAAPFFGYAGLVLLFEVLAFLSLILHYTQGWSFPLIAGAVLSAISFFLVFLKLFKRYRGRPEAQFLLLVIPFGLSFVFFMPPTQVPDELTHIYRLFDLFSNGYDVVVPTAIYDEHVSSYREYANLLFMQSNYSESTIVDFAAGGYSFLLYLVPGIGASIGRFFGLNIFVSIIIAQCFNLIFYAICGYFFIKKMPFGKTILFVYLLNPLLIQQQASCSADALTNIVALGFIVVFTYVYMQKPGEISVGSKVLLVLLLLLLALCKYIYLILALLLLLFLPRINSKKKRVMIVSGLALLSCMAFVFIFLFAGYGGTLSSMVELLMNPIECIKVYWRTFEVQTLFYLQSFSGGFLGSLTIAPPHIWLVYLGMLLTTVFVSSQKETSSFPRAGRICLLATALILCFFLPLTFRSWGMEVDGVFEYLQGAQGRYYIPVFIMFLLAAFNSKKTIYDRKSDIVYSALLIGVMVFELLYVVRFFY